MAAGPALRVARHPKNCSVLANWAVSVRAIGGQPLKRVADALDLKALRLAGDRTAAELKMPEIPGYQLFDWAHPGRNVPAAYKDRAAMP